MIIPTGYAQANFRFTGGGAPTGAEVTLGLDNSGAGGTVSDQAQTVMNAWETIVLPNQSDDIVLAGVLLKEGPNATGASAEVFSGAAGGVSGNAEVPSVSILVRKNTGTGGRAGRGRMYVPGVAEVTFDGAGDMDAVDVAAWDDIWDAFQVELQSATLIPVLLHGPGSPVSLPLPITSFRTQAKAATQRRRLRR